jgi:hypothetical protein
MDITKNDLITTESRTYNSIFRCLEKGESIVVGQRFDICIPEGSKRLNWPPNTYVEIKYRLIYDTISKLQYAFDHSDAEKLIVVTITEDNAPNNLFRASNALSGRNIEIVTYKEFLNNLSNAKINKKLDKSDNTTDSYNKDKDKNIINKVKETIKNNKICLFLGAGVSASAGVVTWEALLEHLCVKKGLAKIDSDIESVVKGRFIIEEYRKLEKKIPDDFYNDMRDIQYANIHPSKLIEAIANLITKNSVESVISYNYDDLVEQEVRKTTLCDSIYDKSRPTDGNFLQIYHVHGFIPQEGAWSPIILGEKEYHKVYQEAYNWGNVEQLHSLCRNVCFFIGLSMKDPNLRRLIDISIDGSEIEPIHYAFLRRIEYDVPFMEKIMRGFGVNCIWYDRHEDLPKLLKELAN